MALHGLTKQGGGHRGYTNPMHIPCIVIFVHILHHNGGPNACIFYKYVGVFSVHI